MYIYIITYILTYRHTLYISMHRCTHRYNIYVEAEMNAYIHIYKWVIYGNRSCHSR